MKKPVYLSANDNLSNNNSCFECNRIDPLHVVKSSLVDQYSNNYCWHLQHEDRKDMHIEHPPSQC